MKPTEKQTNKKEQSQRTREINIYIYIYIYTERVGEGDRQTDRVT